MSRIPPSDEASPAAAEPLRLDPSRATTRGADPAGGARPSSDVAFTPADYRGNRQYITTGNLAENPRVHLFLIDYARRQRVKIWGEARALEDDASLIASLLPPGPAARAEQAIVIRVTAWDRNCPQHIPQRFDAEAVATALAERDAKIAVLEEELRRLRGT
ncbi:MAG TPA: pyridoxamine 5'-phosphate oxidase family protein [Kofleriaceae bacterium]|nr:pyridoxamine 5'-phosphate oxidase family protein [Kofleriaceae bacterium]